MIGKKHKGALVTLDERKSKLRLALPVANKTAEAVACRIITLLGVFKDWVHTLIFNNGKEFAKHAQVANAIDEKPILTNPATRGSVARTRTPAGCYASTFPKQWGCWM
jgi:IS30 family transposase